MKTKFKASNNIAINNQMEIIFKIVEDDVKNGGLLMMFALLNKAFSEVVGRPVQQEDFFNEDEYLAALKLLEQWLQKENFNPKSIN